MVSAAGLPHLREYLRLPRVHSPDFKAQLSPLHAEVVLPRAPDVLIQRDDLVNVTQPGARAVEADAALSWGDGLALTAALDALAHDLEPSRAPNHLPSRHDDGAATAELHQVDLLIAGAEQNEVRDAEVQPTCRASSS